MLDAENRLVGPFSRDCVTSVVVGYEAVVGREGEGAFRKQNEGRGFAVLEDFDQFLGIDG